MAPRRPPKDPQRIKLSDDERSQTYHWLADEIQHALDARGAVIGDGQLLDRWQALYEQAPTSGSKPWPDAADLPTYLVTEKVDALASRFMQVIFGPDPICTVEGWGVPSATIAKVEAFHQWAQENERLQTWIAKALKQALIQGTGILEVSERTAFKKTVTPFTAAVETDPFGSLRLGEDGQAVPRRTENGRIEAWSGQDADARVEIQREVIDYYGEGPEYRLHSLKDFLFLPGHARGVSEVWGYAMRFWARPHELAQMVQQGLYDADAVARLGTDGDRDPRPEHLVAGITIADQQGPTAEKELWRVHLYKDVDEDDICEWVVATVSIKHAALLRFAHDSIGQVRFVPFTPFPRFDSVYGYSYAGHKLGTLADEHTALRNMKADRQTLALSAPITVLSTSTWDPDDEPWGPFAKLTVRSHDDIRQLQIADVPQSVYEAEQNLLAAAERLSGLSDVAMSGVTPQSRRTATEIQAVSAASYARVDEAIKYIQEAMEDLYLLRHRIYQRQLRARDSEGQLILGGLEAPTTVQNNLEVRGIEIPKDGPFKFTAEDLVDNVRFKPRGSVETADKRQLRADAAEFTQALRAVFGIFPGEAQRLAQNPAAAKELLEYLLRLYNVPNLGVFLQQSPGISAPQGVRPQLDQGMPGPRPGAPGPGMGAPGGTGAPAGLLAALQQLQGQGGPGQPPLAPLAPAPELVQ